MLSIFYIIRFLVFLLVIVIGFSNVTKINAATFEESVVTLINSERQKQNLSPLSYSDKLFNASVDHNTFMTTCAAKYGRTSCFVHTVTLLNEATLLNRIKATGYNPQAVAENIAWGYTTPSGVVGAWMNSSGHKANIMGSYKDIGCDYMSSYWTCDFGRSFNTSTVVTPTLTKLVTPTPTKLVTPTPTPSVSQVTPSPTPIVQPTVFPTAAGDKPWWCVYVPTSYLCQ